MEKRIIQAKPLYHNEKWLRRMYEQRGYSMVRIADLALQDLKERGIKKKVDSSSIWDYLVKFNIPRRSNKGKK